MKRHIDKIPGAIHARGYVYNFHFHLIWTTKYRNKVFVTPELTEEMKSILLRVAEIADVTVETIEVMPDHVHMLVSFKPKYAASDIVKNFKGSSARIFFKAHPEIKISMFWGEKLWSNSYFMSTLGDMSREIVEQYINNQYVKEADSSHS